MLPLQDLLIKTVYKVVMPFLNGMSFCSFVYLITEGEQRNNWKSNLTLLMIIDSSSNQAYEVLKF